MLSLLRSIVEAISMVINLLGTIIESIVNFIGMIPTYLTFLLSLVSVVPPFALVFFTAGIYMTITLFVIGRQQG